MPETAMASCPVVMVTTREGEQISRLASPLCVMIFPCVQKEESNNMLPLITRMGLSHGVSSAGVQQPDSSEQTASKRAKEKDSPDEEWDLFSCCPRDPDFMRYCERLQGLCDECQKVHCVSEEDGQCTIYMGRCLVCRKHLEISTEDHLMVQEELDPECIALFKELHTIEDVGSV